MSVRDRDDLVVARLHELAPHLAGEPDRAWQERTRARLVAMAAVRSPAPVPVAPWRRLLPTTEDAASSRWRGRLTAALAGVATAVAALATLVAVSADVGPGDPLYGIKRGTEQTRLALAGDGRGRTLLELARTRMHELEQLTTGGASALPVAGSAASEGTTVLADEADPALVVQTLATMDAQTTEGAAWLADSAVDTGDDEPLDLLAAWSEDQSLGLAALREVLPDSTVDELDGSLARLARISTRTLALSDVLGCAAGVPVEATDQFGPVPGLCLPGGGTPPVAGGEEGPGTVPAPGAGGPPAGTAAVPTGQAPSEGTGDPQRGGVGPGETGGPSVPSVGVPGGGIPSGGNLPSLPGPSLPGPSATVAVPVPGSSTGAGPSSGSGSVPSLPVEVELCLGPLQVNCSD